MKNRKQHVTKPAQESNEVFLGTSSDEMMEDVIGTKVLYNWLYQQEEENYYISAKNEGFLPEFSQQEALFVEY